MKTKTNIVGTCSKCANESENLHHIKDDTFWCENCMATEPGPADYFTAPMYDGEIVALAQLLVRYHNSITEKNCGLYGEKMEKALCRDTFSTLYRHGNYAQLKGIESHFVKGGQQ